jgi:hypothetical protein
VAYDVLQLFCGINPPSRNLRCVREIRVKLLAWLFSIAAVQRKNRAGLKKNNEFCSIALPERIKLQKPLVYRISGAGWEKNRSFFFMFIVPNW